MRPPASVAVVLLRALLDLAKRDGVSPERVLQAIGATPADAEGDAGGWIRVETLTRGWVLVPALCGDPDFGLHAAESAPTGLYGMLELVVMSSPTVYEALERIARMYQLVGGMSEVKLVHDGGNVRVIHRSIVAVEPNRLRHYSEHFLAMIVSRGRALAAQEVSPSQVSFAHDSPVSIDEHRRIFRAPIFFSQPYNELVIDHALLQVPLRPPADRQSGDVLRTPSGTERAAVPVPPASRPSQRALRKRQ
jgi:Arabinose-binding domain of AraC transcription regulator, N-term